MFRQKTENTPLTIRIECEGHTSVSIDDLTTLQGNLKNLTEENYVKLRNSMTEFGFSFPVFYWQSQDGIKFVIDAHQRLATLQKMKAEGWTIPDLPADRIFAKDRTEAKKKLLVLNSRYGEITDSGLTDFLNEEGFEILFEDISDYLEFPEMEIKSDGNSNRELDPKEVAKDLNMKCPKCGFQFQGKEGIETFDNEPTA